MGLPDVLVKITNGALGTVAESPDGVAALVMSGVSSAELALATPKVIYSLPEAEALGITADGTNAAAYRHIKEFFEGYKYISGSDVAELYIMLLADTMTLTQMADDTEASGAKKLVDFAAGRVRLLGLTRKPAGSYEPVLTDGIDADSLTALAKAHLLGNGYATKQQPIRTLIEARAFDIANVGALEDLKTYTSARAGLVMWSTLADGSSSVGYQLGIAAALPVQRNVGRVKNGALPIADAYIGNTRAELVAAAGTIHDKGYQIARTFANRAGYYLNDDPMAAAVSDDYSMLARGRVIDKAHRIAYDTYVDEINDDVEVDNVTGKFPAGYIAYLTQRITNNISLVMEGEISGKPIVNINPNQNFLATNKLKVQLKIVPVGYNKAIEVELGFSNPANA